MTEEETREAVELMSGAVCRLNIEQAPTIHLLYEEIAQVALEALLERYEVRRRV